MSVAPFVVELVVAVFITLCILHQYGNWRKQHWMVTLAVFISWYFSFLIVFILPLDVSSVSICLPPINHHSLNEEIRLLSRHKRTQKEKF